MVASVVSGQPAAAIPDSFRASIDARRTLVVSGTEAAESIVAEVSARRATIEIAYRRIGAAGEPRIASFPLDAFDRLEIRAGGGADFVNIVDPAETLDARRKRLILDGGQGDNVVVITHAPFRPETAARMRGLLELSGQLQDLARRAGEATSAVMASDAVKHADAFRVNVIDETKAIAANADKQLLAPANELTEGRAPRLIEQANAVLARAEEIERRHAALVTSLTRQLDPTNGVFPPEASTGVPLEATAQRIAQQAAGANCGVVIATTHTFTGGSGFDFFIPFSAPSSSWSINGGNGFNILFGGFAADVIQGGAGTDWIFGLKGNDQIRGGDGIDFLFGEFLVDFSFLTPSSAR